MKKAHHKLSHLEIPVASLDLPLLSAGGLQGLAGTPKSSHSSCRGFYVIFADSKPIARTIDAHRTLHLLPGQIALIQASHRHFGEFEHYQPKPHIWLYFTPSHADAERHTPFSRNYLAETDRLLSATGDRILNSDVFLRQAIQRMKHLLREPLTADGLMSLRLLLGQIFVMIVELARKPQGHQDSPTMPAILERIAIDLVNWRCVADIAEEFSMPIESFQYHFKQSTGLSPWHYVLHLRCKKACEELKKPAISITSLAYELGFSSSQHFSTTFKQYIGVPPKIFRKNQGCDELY